MARSSDAVAVLVSKSTISKLARRKSVFRDVPIGFARSQDNAGEVRLVEGVRKVLGFEAEGLPLTVPGAAFARDAFHVVTRVELNTGLSGKELHYPSAFRIEDLSR